ncbi:MAG TPA: hypothetical protein DCE41_17865, partial [Cytophagales bacterium]|nr:hypothetical protein [Cytophagales bacterium]
TTVWQQEGVRITGIRIPHVNRRHRRIQNIAWLVDGGSQRVLHLGDCSADKTAFKNVARMLGSGPSPYIVAPYWLGLSTEGREAMAQLLPPDQGSRKWVFSHLPPQGYLQYVNSLQENFPDATFFTVPGQKIVFQ